MDTQSLKECINACLECAMACEKSAGAWVKDLKNEAVKQFVKLGLDCSDVCIITASFMSRSSKHTPQMALECAQICEAYSTECEKFAQNDLFSRCEKACKDCAEACKRCLMPGRVAA